MLLLFELAKTRALIKDTASPADTSEEVRSSSVQKLNKALAFSSSIDGQEPRKGDSRVSEHNTVAEASEQVPAEFRVVSETSLLVSLPC